MTEPTAPVPTTPTEPTIPTIPQTTPPAEPAPPTPSLINSPTPDPAKPAGAPETYAAFTAPDGVTLDPKAVESISPLLKELGLSQEQAQKLVALQAGREGDLAKAAQAAGREAYEAQRAKDRTEVQRTYGTKLPEVVADIGRALNNLPADVSGPFRQAMDVSGMGDNPAFIRAFHAIAKLVNDGRPVIGNPTGADPNRPNGSRPSIAQAIWGDKVAGAAQGA